MVTHTIGNQRVCAGRASDFRLSGYPLLCDLEDLIV
jgi:hypothetical protein